MKRAVVVKMYGDADMAAQIAEPMTKVIPVDDGRMQMVIAENKRLNALNGVRSYGDSVRWQTVADALAVKYQVKRHGRLGVCVAGAGEFQRVCDEGGLMRVNPGFYNMDCMEAMKQFPDGFFDLAIVDPVYGDVTKGGYMTHNRGQHIGKGSANSKGYHAGLWNQRKTGADYFSELRRVSYNQIIWGGNYFADLLPVSQGWIVWDKEHQADRTFADCELAWTSFNKATRTFRYMWDGMLQGNMKAKENRIHPTQKPVALYNWILKNYAHKGDKILDTHVGSASSLIACHRAGLEYWGFEIDPVYYKAAKERLDRETAQVNIMDILQEV